MGILLTGGNPGLGGIPGLGPWGPFPPLSFLNLDLILNHQSLSASLFTQAIAPRTAMIRIIKTQIHHVLPSSVDSVLVLQHT